MVLKIIQEYFLIMQISSNFSNNSNIYARPQSQHKSTSVGFSNNPIKKDVFQSSIKALEKKIDSKPNKGVSHIIEGLGYLIGQKVKNFLKPPSGDQLVPQIQENYLRSWHASKENSFLSDVFAKRSNSLYNKAIEKQQKLSSITKEEATQIINKKAGL